MANNSNMREERGIFVIFQEATKGYVPRVNPVPTTEYK